MEFETERAARGDAHGLYDLGLAYAKGELVPKDVQRARKLLERALNAGYTRARTALGQLDQEGS